MTLIFVSHGLSTLQLICHRVVWLDAARIRASGEPIRVCQEYYVSMFNGGVRSPGSVVAQKDTGLARFSSVRILGATSGGQGPFRYGEDVETRFSLCAETYPL